MTDMCVDCGENVAECEFKGIDETVYCLCSGCHAHANQALEDCWEEEAQRVANRWTHDFVDPGAQEDDFSADSEEDSEEEDWDEEEDGWESDGPPAPVVTSSKRIAVALGSARALVAAQTSAPWFGPRRRNNEIKFELIATVLHPQRVERSIEKFAYNPVTDEKEDGSAW